MPYIMLRIFMNSILALLLTVIVNIFSNTITAWAYENKNKKRKMILYISILLIFIPCSIIYYTIPNTVIVPDITFYFKDEAKETCIKAGFVCLIDSCYSKIPEKRICKQSLPGGGKFYKGTTIKLTFSLGEPVQKQY
jgi:ABC-type glycerol-3-phosphate transport system permease component